MITRRAATNVAISAVAVLLFQLVSAFTGQVDADRGFGWDGREYGDMVTAVDTGTANTRSRPLFVLPPAALHRLGGVDVVQAFRRANYAYAFALALAICVILDLFAAAWPVKFVIAANIAISIAPSKMFAFYPVQVDLGALAIIAWTFYFATAGRHRSAACCGVLAAAAREFALAVLVYGVVCAWRSGYRPWKAVALYVPGLMAMVALRIWAIDATGPTDQSNFSVSAALANLRLWQSPPFVMTFIYFALTLFGGLSIALLARPIWLARQFFARPELLVFLAPILAATIAGNIDIWRYLVFALPVVIVLLGGYGESFDEKAMRHMVILMTLVTVVTQRPLEQMGIVNYFHDWFPLYTTPERLDVTWRNRIFSTMLLVGAFAALAAQARLTTRRSIDVVE